MSRKDQFRPYTGRGNRTRNALIALLVCALVFAFLAYTYRTDDNFRAAVGSLTAVFRGESRRTPTAPTQSSDPALPSEPVDDATRPTEPSGGQQAGLETPTEALTLGNLLYRAPGQLADLAAAVEAARQGGFDGLLVDLKLNGGLIAYRSQLQNEAVAQAMVADAYDLRALAELCGQQGLLLTGRLSAFSDHIAPGALPGSGVSVASGVVFLDGNYRRNLDPYKERATEYLASLAVEAASMGVREILLTDLAFPHYGKLSLIVYEGERSKADQLLHCIELLREAAGRQGAVTTVELPLNVFLDRGYAQVSGQEFAFTGRLRTGVALHSGMSAELVTEEELRLLQEAVSLLPEDTTRSLVISAETLEAALPIFSQTGATRLAYVESGG